MPLTPDDIKAKEFHTSFRGYNEVEVDTFLDEVEAEIARLRAENADLAQRLAAAQAATPVNEGDEMLRRTLLLAQRTADETVAAAQAEAERVLGEAREQAQATLSAAQSQVLAAVGDLERRKQTLEQHIEGLRAFEREYRTRLKAYLEAQLRELDGRAASAAGAAAATTAATPPPAPGATPAPAQSAPPPPPGATPPPPPGAVGGPPPGQQPPAGEQPPQQANPIFTPAAGPQPGQGDVPRVAP